MVNWGGLRLWVWFVELKPENWYSIFGREPNWEKIRQEDY